MFDTGPQFVFNIGGGPGIRVHQFGGGRPRRRPREANAAEERPQSLVSTLIGLLPLLIILTLPLLSSLFSSSETIKEPQIRFSGPQPPFTIHRQTRDLKVDYYYNPADVGDYNDQKFTMLDKRAEYVRVNLLRIECKNELRQRQDIIDEAQGWFFQDQAKLQQAENMKLRSCQVLHEMGVPLH